MNKLNTINKQMFDLKIDNSLISDHSQVIRGMMLSSPTYRNYTYQDQYLLDIENALTDKKLYPIRETMVSYSE